MTQREEKIANDLDSAEQSRVAAAKMEKNVNNNYFLPDQKQLKLLKTRKKVENRLAKTLKETTAEVTLTRKARTDISQEREEALSSVKNEVADLLFKQPKF